MIETCWNHEKAYSCNLFLLPPSFPPSALPPSFLSSPQLSGVYPESLLFYGIMHLRKIQGGSVKECYQYKVSIFWEEKTQKHRRFMFPFTFFLFLDLNKTAVQKGKLVKYVDKNI